MSNQNSNIKKICSFYVSGWHLISMLLPYISKQSNKNIINISEENLKELVEVFLSKLNLTMEKQEELLKINWNNKKISNINNNQIIIISGTEEFINKINQFIERKIKKSSECITIINCYEVMEFNKNINEILNKHNKILNTSGEKEIYEVFEGYRKTINE